MPENRGWILTAGLALVLGAALSPAFVSVGAGADPRIPPGGCHTSCCASKEAAIERCLNKRISVEFGSKATLHEIVDDFREVLGVNIVVDQAALEEQGIDCGRVLECKIKLENVSAKCALSLALRPWHLTHCFRDEVLLIIPERAQTGMPTACATAAPAVPCPPCCPVQQCSAPCPVSEPCPCPVAKSHAPKQYGCFVLDDFKLKTDDKVVCTIKKIKFMYKGDGIEADVSKCFLNNFFKGEEKESSASCCPPPPPMFAPPMCIPCCPPCMCLPCPGPVPCGPPAPGCCPCPAAPLAAPACCPYPPGCYSCPAPACCPCPVMPPAGEMIPAPRATAPRTEASKPETTKPAQEECEEEID